MSLDVRVLTPEKVFLRCETDQVILPSATGSIGILSDHASLVTVLEPGVLRYETEGNWIPAVLYAGFAEIENNLVTVIVNGAEPVLTSNDFEELEKAFISATETLEKVKASGLDADDCKPTLVKMQIAKARLDALKYLK
jgi:F-type H+-transporting ATPase subunit epsilon